MLSSIINILEYCISNIHNKICTILFIIKSKKTIGMSRWDKKVTPVWGRSCRCTQKALPLEGRNEFLPWAMSWSGLEGKLWGGHQQNGRNSGLPDPVALWGWFVIRKTVRAKENCVGPFTWGASGRMGVRRQKEPKPRRVKKSEFAENFISWGSGCDWSPLAWNRQEQASELEEMQRVWNFWNCSCERYNREENRE